MPKTADPGGPSPADSPRGESKADWPFRRPHPAVAAHKKSLIPKKVAPKTVLLREKLVQSELALAKLGIREQGGNNHGPWMKKFLAECGLPEGYPWCAALQSYELHQVAGGRLPIESASVAAWYAFAAKSGWLFGNPARGDFCLFDFDGDGQFDDHIGLVVKVVSLGGYITLRTVEGNTSSGVAGSQSDGDGVFLRTRVIPRNRVAFVRVPGMVAA